MIKGQQLFPPPSRQYQLKPNSGVRKIRKQRFSIAAAAAIVGFAGLQAFPLSADAINAQPPKLYIAQDAPLYNQPGQGETVGMVSAGQNVTVLGMDKETGDWEASGWYQIDTWLGPKWVPADRLINGVLKTEDQIITSVTETALYDRPNRQAATGLRLSAQELKATGILPYGPLSFSNATSYNLSSGIWYRVETWLGEKWILNPPLLQNVKETPASYSMKLTAAETAYPDPFFVQEKGEALNPQVVQVIGEWDHRTGPGMGQIWYKIRLSQGERWIAPRNPVLKEYREVKETLALPTDTRYFSTPQLTYDGKDWLPAGTYEAFEASGDWVHIRTSQEQVWVNPKQAILERPLGIVPTTESVQLTKESATVRFPLGDPAHSKGYFAPQTVQAFEKWTDPASGEVWYHFHGTGGGEWVKKSGPGSLDIGSGFLESAAQGSLQGIKAKLGMTKQELIDHLGEPDLTGASHTEYVQYGKSLFYLWGEEKILSVMDISYDTTVGQLKEALGTPDFDNVDDGATGNYVVGYQAGEYYVYFNFARADSDTCFVRYKKIAG